MLLNLISCGSCCDDLEPETINTVARMSVAPTETETGYYNFLIRKVKINEGLCLGVLSLHQRFVAFHIRACHDKQAALLDWTKNEHDGTEVGTIRFEPFIGVGGSTSGGNSYIRENYTQVDDYFSISSKFGGYVTADFNNRIIGFRTTNIGADAAELSLSPNLGNRMYDSWGTARMWFESSGAGLYEIERGGTYSNGGFGGNRTIRYQGEENLTVDPGTATFRDDFQLNFYSLALNSSNISTPVGSPIEINTAGYAQIQYTGSRLIHSVKMRQAIEQYLALIPLTGVIGDSYEITASSSEEGNSEGNVKDSDFGTRWSASGAGQYVTMELTALYEVDSIQVAVHNGATRIQYFDVQYSLNGVDFFDIDSFATSGTTSSFENFTFDTVVARYIRFVGQENSVNTWNSITEIRLNNPAVVIIPDPEPEPEPEPELERYSLGSPLWVPNMQNAPLGSLLRTTTTTNPDGGTIWRFANELSGPGGYSTQVVIDPSVPGLSGPKTIKSTLNLTPVGLGGTGTLAGIRHFEQNSVFNHNEHIFEVWYYVPQVITNVGWSCMMYQWKQNYNNWIGYWPSHVTVAIYLRNRSGQNYLTLIVGNGPNWGTTATGADAEQHPTKNIPIGEWFGIRGRYKKSSAPGVADGRAECWQIDLDGTVTPIGDHDNIVTWWDETGSGIPATGFPGEMIRGGFALYGENMQPYVITTYHDKVGYYLPADIELV